VVAVGLGATRNTLPWTATGQVWVDQGFLVSMATTVGLLGVQLGLNELAWWDHRGEVALAPWWSRESAGLVLTAAF